MADNGSANIPLLIPRSAMDAAVEKMLRLFVGRGKRWSIVDLAAASGVPERKIECAKREPGDPEHRGLRTEEMFSIMSVLGIPAQNIALALMGTEAHETDPQMLPAGTVVAKLVTAAGAFAERGADGVFCNRDKGDLRPFADEMIEIITPFSSKAG